MKRRTFLAACCWSLALLVLPASQASADRFEFRIRRQNGHRETVVVHAKSRLAAESKLRKDHPKCVVLHVKHTNR